MMNLLTRRQIEIVAMMAEGKGNQEIANALGLSMSTVKNHVGRILEVLHAQNRAHAVAVAIWRGLIKEGSS